MNINEKIEAVRLRVKNGDTALANKIGADALNAIFKGMYDDAGNVTAEWETLMSNYTDDQAELDRLCGRDQAFNNSRWGSVCLAYIAGDSVCTSDTAILTGGRRSIISRDLIAGNTELQDTLDSV